MNYRTRIFGYMRFSFLGKSDARLSRGFEGQERFDLVFSEARMAQRFYVFENITLPSLKAQSFTDWHMDLVISKTMPQRYKTRLHGLVASVPQLSIFESEAANVKDAIQPLINSRVQSPARTIHFRTDDDDALSSHLMAKLNYHIDRAPRDTLINFPNGLLLHSNGKEANVYHKTQHMVAICWSLVNEPGQARNPYHFRHSFAFQRFPSIVLPEFSAYIQTAHDSCDTAPKNERKLYLAKKYSPNYETSEAQRQDINSACKRNFRWTNYDDLISIFEKLPEGPEFR